MDLIRDADWRHSPGIGQKKAAMAVEILARDLGKPFHELSGGDVAYDVHSGADQLADAGKHLAAVRARVVSQPDQDCLTGRLRFRGHAEPARDSAPTTMPPRSPQLTPPDFPAA